LKSAIKEQQQLVIALKSFVEDKVSSFESQLTLGEDNTGEREKQQRSATSWPSATLPVAYFTALLLSSVVSSVGATSVVNRLRPNIRRQNLNGVRDRVVLPMHYVLPGLETVDSRGKVKSRFPPQPAKGLSLV
jgi:hypothetical protein